MNTLALRFSLLSVGGVFALSWLIASVPFVPETSAAEAARTSLNPGRSVPEQIAYMKKSWPDQFAVAVIEAVGSPTRIVEEKDVAYCDQEVRPVDWIFVRWLNSSPRAPGDRFRIHYWIQPKRGERQLRIGERAIVFMVPSHLQGTFVTEMILTADEKTISNVRQSMADTLR